MGPRRLPPNPPSHPAARLNKDNSILSFEKTVNLSRSLLSRPRARRGSARARFTGSLHAIGQHCADYSE